MLVFALKDAHPMECAFHTFLQIQSRQYMIVPESPGMAQMKVKFFERLAFFTVGVHEHLAVCSKAGPKYVSCQAGFMCSYPTCKLNLFEAILLHVMISGQQKSMHACS